MARKPLGWFGSVAFILLSAASAQGAQFAVEVTASRLNVRERAGGARLGSVARGRKFVVNEEQGDWSRIDWRGRQAWVFSRHLRQVNADAVAIDVGAVNVRSGGSSSASLMGIAREDQTYVKLGEVSNWTRIQYDDRAAWIASWLLRDVNLGGGATPPSTTPTPARRASRMRVTQAELEILARICKGEAGVASYEGKVAVVAVVLNRVDDWRYPNTVAGVAHQPYQFSAYDPGVRDRLYWGPIPQSCWNAAREAVNGRDPSGGATHYFNPFLVLPNWASTLRFIKRIGSTARDAHDFYVWD